jgi:hypothetical protein
MKNIHILPTNKPSRLIKSQDNDFVYLNTNAPNWFENNLKTTKQNIYITSDEEIKEENLTKSIYVIDVQNGNIGKLTCKNRFFKGSCKLIGIEWSNKQDIWNYYHIKEIILTTDPSLIADGVQAIDDEFLEWFVKNPTCEFVEVNEKLIIIQDKPLVQHQGNKPIVVPHRINYKIIIPQEEPKPIHEQIIEHCGGEEKFMKICDLKPKQEKERGITITNVGKQETLEDKKFQQKLVDKLNNGELSYQNAPIYTILLDLVQGNSVDEVYRVFCEVIKEQNKKLYSEEDMWEAYKAADSIFYDINALKLEFEKWLNNLKKK